MGSFAGVWVLLLTGFICKSQAASPLAIWKLDAGFLALVVALAIFSTRWRRAGTIATAVLSWLLASWYLLDALALKVLDRHANVQSLWAFAQMPTVVRSQLAYAACYFLPAIVIAFTLPRFSKRRLPLATTALPVFLFLGALLPNPGRLARFAFSEALHIEHWRQPEVSWKQLEAVLGSHPAKRVRETLLRPELPPGNPNLILLVVESFSSALSLRTGGTLDAMPRFDRQANKGTLFTNFFANGENSFLAMGSLLNGLLPLSFVERPNNLDGFYEAFRHMPSIAREYKNAGYSTLYAVNSEWWYQPIRDYMAEIGIDEVVDSRNTVAMQRFPRISGYLSDDALYETALARLPRAMADSRPFFWTLETMESHDTAGKLERWHEVDRKLAAFLDRLEAAHFFDHGILMVTGDHRLREGFPPDFAAKYGAAARARVPLFLRGHGVAAGRTDARYFMQADLLRRLASAIRGGSAPLSPQIVFLDDSWHMTPIRVLAIDEQSTASAVISGMITFWPERPPAARQQFEKMIELNQAAQYFQLRKLASEKLRN